MKFLDEEKRQPRNVQLASHPSFAGLVAVAGSLNPIPSRTRPLNSPAPMVLSLKAWKSRSLPGLQRTDAPHHDDLVSPVACVSARFKTSRRGFPWRLFLFCARSRSAQPMFEARARGLCAVARHSFMPLTAAHAFESEHPSPRRLAPNPAFRAAQCGLRLIAQNKTRRFRSPEIAARHKSNPAGAARRRAHYCGFTNRPTRPAAPLTWPLSFSWSSGSVRPAGSALGSRSVEMIMKV
jgi:hypothetical protein